jgi:hypothetical protein
MPKLLPKLEEMTDILDLKDMRIWNLTWAWILLVSIVVILLAFLLYAWWKKRRAGKVPALPPKTPLQVALEGLDELVNSRLAETGQIRRFYFKLSDIFREFIENELHLMALETTLEELRPKLKKCPDLEGEEANEALWLLELADLAKFAKFVPDREDLVKSVKVCRLWVSALAQRRELQRNAALKAEGVSV